MDKYQFGLIAIAIVGSLQCVAWLTHKNGQIFAFTSLVIGLVIGKILDIKYPKETLKP